MSKHTELNKIVHQLYPKSVMQLEHEALIKIAKHARWLNKILSTSCDGGDLWCAIRNRPGALSTVKGLGDGFKELAQARRAARTGAPVTKPAAKKRIVYTTCFDSLYRYDYSAPRGLRCQVWKLAQGQWQVAGIQRRIDGERTLTPEKVKARFPAAFK
jgi:hypothetical protein